MAHPRVLACSVPSGGSWTEGLPSCVLPSLLDDPDQLALIRGPVRTQAGTHRHPVSKGRLVTAPAASPAASSGLGAPQLPRHGPERLWAGRPSSVGLLGPLWITEVVITSTL